MKSAFYSIFSPPIRLSGSFQDFSKQNRDVISFGPIKAILLCIHQILVRAVRSNPYFSRLQLEAFMWLFKMLIFNFFKQQDFASLKEKRLKT